MAESAVKDEIGPIGQAFQAYQVGQHLVDQMNVEIAADEEQQHDTAAGVGRDSDSSDSGSLPEQLRRYLPLDQYLWTRPLTPRFGWKSIMVEAILKGAWMMSE